MRVVATASLADVQAFQALEPELQAQLVRLFGFNPLEEPGIVPDEAGLEEAFEAGWDAAVEHLRDADFETTLFELWLDRRNARTGGA